MTAGLRSRGGETQAPQLSECGHDRSCLDFGTDRDIKCRTCWENREILIQRLIEPFEHALGSFGVDAVVTGDAVVSSQTASTTPAERTTGRTRSLRRRAGSKRTRSESRGSTPTPKAQEMKEKTADGGYSLRSANRTMSEPEEEDCIRVQDLSLMRSRSQDSSGPVGKSIKPASHTTRFKEGGIKWWESGGPGTHGKSGKLIGRGNERSPSVASTPASRTKAATQPVKKPQQKTLFSFFTPRPAGDNSVPAPPSHAKSPDIPSPTISPTSSSQKNPAVVQAVKVDLMPKAKEKRLPEKVRKQPRSGTRRSMRDVKKDNINYKEDSDSDVDLED
ncbi:hypothetical protein L873DRAFT_1812323 [Choiromyces venosus 120613-1]|uniref:Uncharacterized protein n=1 Tax=Choiromyces venosus 120613-1 TaxID=1336337 RepID=A0A3N4JC00_9PEZI|nr:hypothetical protein L873DRAFT_1812323 [Choiromyces venosus 120613-1]